MSSLSGLSSQTIAYVSGEEEIILSSGNEIFDRLLAGSLARITGSFGVVPGFAYFEEEDAPHANAYATPAPRMNRSDGTVLFGKRLLSRLIRTSEAPDAAILAVCAHEYGHVVQNKMGLRGRLLLGEKTQKRLELHADFLAGYFAGIRKKDRPAFASAVFALTMHNVGDNNVTAKSHHGTPQERAAAVIAGFRLGHESDSPFPEVVESGVKYVGA